MNGFYLVAAVLLLSLNLFTLGRRTQLLIPKHIRPTLIQATRLYSVGVLCFFFTFLGVSEAFKIKSLKKWDSSLSTLQLSHFLILEKLSDALVISFASMLAFGNSNSFFAAILGIGLLVSTIVYFRKFTDSISTFGPWVAAILLTFIAFGFEFSGLYFLIHFFKTPNLGSAILPALIATWAASLPPWPWGKWAAYPAAMSAVLISNGLNLETAGQISGTYFLMIVLIPAGLAISNTSPFQRKQSS